MLAAREEADLERMMAECEFAIGNAEAFVEQLANDLSVLDGVRMDRGHIPIKYLLFCCLKSAIISSLTVFNPYYSSLCQLRTRLSKNVISFRGRQQLLTVNTQQFFA